MKDPPADTAAAIREAQRCFLAHWLREWHIDTSLQEGEPAQDKAPLEANFPADHDNAEASRLDIGQIRLLHPRRLPSSAGPLYLALLSTPAATTCMSAPYSRFTVPAFDSELLTERKPTCLRVLSLGFTRPLARSLLTDSWPVDRMTEDEMADALALFRHVRRGAALSHRLACRTGAPMVHPNDPRHRYGEEMAAMMDRLWTTDTAHNEGSAIRFYPDSERTALPVAAEPHATYGTPVRLRIEHTSLVVTARSSAGDTMAEITVTDATGRISPDADGSILLARDGRMSPPIRKGQLRWPSPPELTHCRLQHPDGSLSDLTPA